MDSARRCMVCFSDCTAVPRAQKVFRQEALGQASLRKRCMYVALTVLKSPILVVLIPLVRPISGPVNRVRNVVEIDPNNPVR